MSTTDTTSGPPPTLCPWPWCHSETATAVSATRMIAHTGAPISVSVSPDELNIYLVAVDDQEPNVVIESTVQDPLSLVLAVDQAECLAAAISSAVAIASACR